MIDVTNLSKRYGEKLALDDLTFQAKSGIVTGFLGPNGAGKSTTMRMMVGLDAPTTGTVTIDGSDYRSLAAPLRDVGTMLEARAIHTGRSAHNHLLAMAQTHGIGVSRVKEVIELVGLEDVARSRVGTFSLGMGQRLGIASALLGDPHTVILDEPANGLDPEGILWIRNLLKGLADEGRTVFLSSHLMSEIALTADHVVVVGRGRLVADASVEEIVAEASGNAAVHVRCERSEELARALKGPKITIEQRERGVIAVHGLTGAQISKVALQEKIILDELTPQKASLEEAFMRLTGDSVEYRTAVLDEAEVEVAA